MSTVSSSVDGTPLSSACGTAMSADTSDDELDGNDLESIAVCGFSLRFPQDAISADSFWKMLCDQTCAMTEIPKDRINLNGFYSRKNYRNTLPLRGGHFIKENLAAFDADFFSISPTEAASMDPMQRILLETAYRALENSGIPMESAWNSMTSVYTGCFGTDHVVQLCRDAEQPPMYAALGLGSSMLANRISWFFNLHGPSIGVDSACSSTAMALDLACQSLRSRSCDMSLVAGSNLTYSPESFTWMSNINFLSPDSRCYSFDHRANGYARGEGVAVMVIKRLSDALRDGNTIRAVIRSTGSNEDGRTPGITQPCAQAQEKLIKETYRRAGLSLAHTRFFEAHGTGTPIGDPREAQAIGNVFQKYRTTKQPLYVGAVKSNIGHLEGASGLAGVIKAIIALEKGVIPPNTNFEKCNTEIDTEYLKIKFPTQCEPWPTSGLRRASINSFGYGGANSHVVIDDAYNYLRLRDLHGKHNTMPIPPQPVQLDIVMPNLMSQRSNENYVSTQPKLLFWSAADEHGIARLASCFVDHFQKLSIDHSAHNTYLANLAYTLHSHRSRLPWRSFSVMNSYLDLIKLREELPPAIRVRRSAPRVGFVFTGQGAQWYAMGRELLRYCTFKASLREAERYLRSLGCPWSVFDELCKSSIDSRIDDPAYSQPLCTILQVAIVDLMYSFGVQPVAVVGHSSGEIAAAYCAAHISRESAWKLAYFRGVLTKKLVELTATQKPCSMMSVGLPEDEAAQYVLDINKCSHGAKLTISCINSPKNVTISGEAVLLEKLRVVLNPQNVFTRLLKVPLAYHSSQMSLITDEYISKVGSLVRPHHVGNPVVFVSSVTGHRIDPEHSIQTAYWSRNMVSPVLFSQALFGMCEKGRAALRTKIDRSHLLVPVVDHLVEIGPHSALEAPVVDVLATIPRGREITYSSVLKRHKSAVTTIMHSMGELCCMGYDVNLNTVNETEGSQPPDCSLLVDLPEYPFDHSQNYWFESRTSKAYRLREHVPNQLLGARCNDWSTFNMRWRNVLRMSDMPWIEQHKVNGTIVYPAAGMLTMVLEALRETAEGPNQPTTGLVLRNVRFETPIDLSTGDNSIETVVSLQPAEYSPSCRTFDFTITSFQGSSWRCNCRGLATIENKSDGIDIANPNEQTHPLRTTFMEQLRQQCCQILAKCDKCVDTSSIYTFLHRSGLEYGYDFQRASNPRTSQTHEAVASVPLYRGDDDENRSIIHPINLDAIMHIGLIAYTRGGAEPMPTCVPTEIDYMWVPVSGLNAAQTSATTSFGTVTSRNQSSFRVDCCAMTGLSSSDFKVILKGVQMTHIALILDPKVKSPATQQSYMKIIRKPAISKMTNDDVFNYLEAMYPATDDRTDFVRELHIVLETYLRKLLNSSCLKDPDAHNNWKRHYLNWAQHHLRTRNRSNTSVTAHSFEVHDPHFLEVCTQLKESNAIGRLFVEVAENLNAIFRNEVNPLQLLFESNLAENYYREVCQHKSVKQAAEYVNLLSHQNPGLRILEIGAGTGSGTSIFVNTLTSFSKGETSSFRCARYDFTDISPSFLERAKKSFQPYSDKMTFRVLDMEMDFVDQGFGLAEYDIVIAIKAVHATHDIAKALTNIRRVLKPGGKLLLEESFKPAGWSLGFVFGLLPGWWLGVDNGRNLSPSVSVEAWDISLKSTSFSGSDIVLKDFDQEESHEFGFIISTAVDPTASLPLPAFDGRQIMIVGDSISLLQKRMAEELYGPLWDAHGLDSRYVTLDNVQNHMSLTWDLVILLVDYGHPCLGSVDEGKWFNLRSLINCTQRLLWVSSGGGQTASDLDYGLLTGFQRVLRSEYCDLVLISLALEGSNGNSEDRAQIVVALKELIMAQPNRSYEAEYTEAQGLLHVDRVIDATRLAQEMEQKLLPFRNVQSSIEDAVPFTLKSGHEANEEGPSFIEDETPAGDLQANYVEIVVTAVSLDAYDRAIATGRSESKDFGAFCAGKIVRAGVETPLAIGDRVFALFEGCFRSSLRVCSSCVVRLPDDMSDADACIVLPAVIEANYALMELGRLRKKDSVFIQGSNTLVGQAALAMCQQMKVQELFTDSTKDISQLLQSSTGSSTIRVVSSSHCDLQIKELASKGAVDIIVDCAAGTVRKHCISLLKPLGRLLSLQHGSNEEGRYKVSCELPPNINLTSVNLRQVIKEDPARLDESLAFAASCASVLGLHANQMGVSFTVSELDKALDHLRQLENDQRVVITLARDDIVTVKTRTEASCTIDRNGTYVVAGGLGGLGRAIARWLVSRGARCIVLLSRSGPKSTEARDLLQELRMGGVHVETPCCDISIHKNVRSVFEDASRRLPPFKGCIQASMVLKDSTFQKMTYSDWSTTINPKVKGSWNLHDLLPQGLDFFVMISSITGITGAASQANYAAGNTYMDALAHYRISRGERATSLCIGAVADEGYLTRHSNILDDLRRTKAYIPVWRQELCGLLDIYCDPSNQSTLSQVDCQPIIGIKPQAQSLADGAELPITMYQPFWQHMHHVSTIRTNLIDGDDASRHCSLDAMRSILEAKSLAEAATIATTALSKRISSLLGVPDDRIDFEKPAHSYGIDSLSAIMLRNFLKTTFDVDVGVFDILGGATSLQIGTSVVTEILNRQKKLEKSTK